MLRYTPALNLNARVVLRVLYALRTPAPHAGDRLAKAVTFHKRRVLRAHVAMHGRVPTQAEWGAVGGARGGEQPGADYV